MHSPASRPPFAWRFTLGGPRLDGVLRARAPAASASRSAADAQIEPRSGNPRKAVEDISAFVGFQRYSVTPAGTARFTTDCCVQPIRSAASGMVT